MAKKKVSLQRTGAFALAMTTALSTLSFSAANAAQSSHDTDTIDVPDTDTVTKVIPDYQATLDREWTDSSASTGASRPPSRRFTTFATASSRMESPSLRRAARCASSR